VFLVPDHGDRLYVQEMTGLLLGEMGFKEIAIHQAGGMSSVSTVVLLLI
jgi:actin-related protein 8